MSLVFTLVAGSVFLLFVLFIIYQKKHRYWKNRGVIGPTPFPFLGNVAESFLMKTALGEIYTNIYNQYSELPYVGVYKFGDPALLVRDNELLNDVLIRQFSHFRDNFITDVPHDDLLRKNVFVLRGEEWKTVRTKLSNCFTAGKMKILVPLIKESADKMVNYISVQLESNPSTIVDGKELAAKFTTENIATCAFGVEGKCFEDPNSEFRELGRKMFETSLSRGLQMLLLVLSPKAAAKLDIRFIPMPVQKRFKQLISTILEYRRKNNIVRNDFLHIIDEVKDEQFMATDADVAGQAAGFFVEGFETSSIAMDFTLYELANNKPEQEKLRKEINSVLSKHNDCLSYEIIQEMAYLDGVCKEALRMHPLGLFLEKICSQDYVMPPQSKDGKPIEIKKGVRIVIPAYGIHMDPRYYPEPTRFNPERFLPENRSSIQKCTYLAFSEGPRVCLGQRFALMQIKIGLIYIVKNFEITINEKTCRPLKIDPNNFINAPKGGIWYNFKKINS